MEDRNQMRCFFFVYSFADVRHTVLGNKVTVIEHLMEAIIHHLNDDEETCD